MKEHSIYLTNPEIYLPELVLSNQSLSKITGKDEVWFEKRTGIIERRRAATTETNWSLGIKAVEKLSNQLSDVDMIIGATYTPSDTLGAIGYRIQKHFEIKNARVINISTGCSSFINAVEIGEQFIKSRLTSKILIVASELNSQYSVDDDLMGGHLWGDGAGAIILSKNSTSGNKVLGTYSKGLGHIGNGPEAINLIPYNGGLKMINGRDVFYHACQEMKASCIQILTQTNLTLEDIDFIIPHQANQRIIDRLIAELDLNPNIVLSNIRKVGNTGSASTLIAMAQNQDLLKSGDKVLFTVFGGGYSTGAMIIEVG